MDKKHAVLKPIPADQIEMTGHYVDHELVSNIEKDTKKRITRIKSGRPKKLLLSLGGAGAQAETYMKIIDHVSREIRNEDVIVYFNIGDHKKIFNFENTNP